MTEERRDLSLTEAEARVLLGAVDGWLEELWPEGDAPLADLRTRLALLYGALS